MGEPLNIPEHAPLTALTNAQMAGGSTSTPIEQFVRQGKTRKKKWVFAGKNNRKFCI